MRNRGIVGPVAMITVGTLFMLDEFTRYEFHRTWPMLLIAIGIAIAISRMGSESAPTQLPAPGPETHTDKVTHG